jgi:hypothetical protein
MVGTAEHRALKADPIFEIATSADLCASVLAMSYSFAESRRQQKVLRTPHVSHIMAFL